MSTIDALEKDIERVGDEVQKSGEPLRSKAETTVEDFIDLVRRHPAKAIGFSLAAGVAVGTLVTASTRRRYSTSDQIKNLAGAGSDAWERLRNGFEEATCALKDAVDEAIKKFK